MAPTAAISGVTIRNRSFGWLSSGGILNEGTLNLDHSTISGNMASLFVGGIDNAGNLFVTNRTICQNDANGDAGAIRNQGTSNVYNTTIVFNHADADHGNAGSVGGVYNSTSATFNLRNTLLAGNLGSHPLFYEDCYGTVRTRSMAASRIWPTPVSTKTRCRLPATSAARRGWWMATTTASARCDIGAFEYRPPVYLRSSCADRTLSGRTQITHVGTTALG